jgi:hypothetical protein
MGRDRFMDGRHFDANHWQEYLEGFSISRSPAGRRSAEASGVGAEHERAGAAI